MSKIVNRTLEVFEAFAAARRPLALTELMKVLDIPVSSCHDVVRALQERGYLYEVRPRGGFYPTARLFNLARVLVEHDPFLARAQPVLERLRDQAGESVFLMKAQGSTLTYVAVIDADTPLRLTVKVGDSVRALHATSAGKALLASLDDAELDALIAKLPLKALTPGTLTTRTALKRDLRAGRERGWFLNREESVEDSLTVSAGFHWFEAFYTVTVAGSVKRMDRKLDTVVRQLRKAIGELDEPGAG